MGSYLELQQQLGQARRDMRAVVNQPRYILPFLQPGRLVSIATSASGTYCHQKCDTARHATLLTGSLCNFKFTLWPPHNTRRCKPSGANTCQELRGTAFMLQCQVYSSMHLTNQATQEVTLASGSIADPFQNNLGADCQHRDRAVACKDCFEFPYLPELRRAACRICVRAKSGNRGAQHK